jgi:hypothetical protein
VLQHFKGLVYALRQLGVAEKEIAVDDAVRTASMVAAAGGALNAKPDSGVAFMLILDDIPAEVSENRPRCQSDLTSVESDLT